MTKPQQPEIARSGRGEVDPNAAKTRHGGPTDQTPPTGAIPEENLPGHHPDEEQDKPAGPPPRPKARARSRPPTKAGAKTGTKAAAKTATKTADASVEGEAKASITDLNEARRDKVEAEFEFAFESRMAPFAYPLGITPWTTSLRIEGGRLHVRFGPWSLTTTLDNVEDVCATGPYSMLKVAGPPHLSLADRGVTMATSTKRGVCIRFREPVPALVPKGMLRHPALTVTVEEPDRLMEVLNAR